jgi:hypothetical protein
MSCPDFTKWTDAQLKMTPEHLFGKHLAERDAELERRKSLPSDGSEERVARLIKDNTKPRRGR